MLSPMLLKAKSAASAYFSGPPTPVPSTLTAVGAAEAGLRNIVGWGIGKRSIGDKSLSGADVVRVYVREELPDQSIPEEFEGLQTDVIVVGRITAYQSMTTWHRLNHHRPTSCGVSVGHPNVTEGTLGCLVEKEGNHYILSNNHVLAATNAAQAGDIVIQPGPKDGGTVPNDEIATLEPYQVIDFTGNANEIDAAIALVGPSSQTNVVPEIIGIGTPKTTTKTAQLGQAVRKHGRTTGQTLGVVVDCSANVKNVDYGNASARFDNQIMIEAVDSATFAKGGDSGSLIVDAVTLEPVALLFAGPDESPHAFANPITRVLEYYQVTIVG